MVGIITYGAYIPRYRIRVEEITKVWGANAADITGGLGVFEKSVPDLDEDAATIAVEAARNALKRRNVDPKKIGAVYVGSESHPYAVKPTACTVGEAIGATPQMTAADYEFACKAGTAAIQTCMGLVKSNMVTYGLAIGSDVSQGAPSDALEYTAAAGGAAFVIGGRFTGDPGYFKHVKGASLLLFEQMHKTAKDYDYAVFHQPNAKFPQKVAKDLGFKPQQIKPGLVVPHLGNTYSGASPIGLAATLDIAKPGDRIFVCSFGSDAGSDAFDITVTDAITSNAFHRDAAPSVQQLLKDPIYLDYARYAKHKGKIVMQS
jgi:hydroxymethylglutaryl-CoA synthase